jgi:hypothetical protein
MEKLIKTNFLKLVRIQKKEFNQDELAESYNKFARKLMQICKKENDYFTLLEVLTYIRVELWSAQEQKINFAENDTIEHHLKKSLLLIELMINNCKIRIMYLTPSKMNHNTSQGINYDLKWEVSENNIIELAMALHRANIAYNKGKYATFIDIQRNLERFFGKGIIKRPYNKKSKLSDRVTITPFLDKLKNSFLRDNDSN